MAALTEIRRVTVVAETSLEKTLIDEFLKLGAKGYTCFYCFGKGKHEVMEDPYTGRSQVHIMVLARPPAAEAILQHVHRLRASNHKLVGCMDTVLAYADDDFF
jgi:hypothetical protein